MKNTKKIIAAVLTVIMMISMLPTNAFATEPAENDAVESAVEAVSTSSEEQNVETTVEDISEDQTEAVSENPAEDHDEAVSEDLTEEASIESSDTDETVETADPAAEETEAPVEETVEETEEADVAAGGPVTLEAEGDDYVVTVTYDASALLPEDVKIEVEEILENARKYDSYCDQALEAVQKENEEAEEISYIKLFDITLVDGNGRKVQPKAAVDVQIRLKDVKKVEESTQVVHFAGNAETPEIVDSEIKGKDVSFEADGFSIYAVIGTGDKERLTVKFFGAKNDTTGEYSLIDTMYVKKADQASAATIKTIINDPGAGEVPENYSFFGWSIGNKDYPAEAGSTIDDVRNYVQTLAFSDGEVLEVYAMYVTHYTVKYIADGGVNLKSDTILVTKAGDLVDYTVNMSYPSDSEHQFKGWMPTDHASNITDPEGATATNLFENGTPIKIKGDVTFSVSAPEGHWLVFHENGKYATYNAPQFVESGENTSGADVLPMERNGYTFDGWYLGAPSEEGGDPTGAKFEFGSPITETTDIYAKWIGNTLADYTVIIWKEGLEEGTYDYGEAVTVKNARVGQPVSVSKKGSGDAAHAVIDGREVKYKGFHLREENPIVESNAVVSPEGNTVVNVYYDRTVYTLTFVLSIHIPFVGDWDAITYDTITARYGTYIGDQFPIKGSLFVKWLDSLPFGIGDRLSEYLNSFHRWQPRNSQELKKVTVFIDTMPAENITFYRDDENTARLYLNYYGEALPGERVDHSWDGKDWILISATTARYNYFSEKEDFVEIIGYDKYKTNPEFDSSGVNSTTDRMNFYYTRELAKITYLNGWKYDGNGARVEGIDGTITQSEDIPFGADLSDYNKGKKKYFVPETSPEGYVFEGWYVDKYCTKEFEFETMPAGGITVYAKWREIEYRVFLRPNAGTDSTLTWGSDDQETNFRVGYGDKISAPFGLRKGYKFLGWHYDKELTRPVYAANIVVNESVATDIYDKTLQENMTDPSDPWGNANATENADVDRWWITNRFELFAKWGKDPIGADGIRVVFNAGEDGTNPPKDTVPYQDNTTAVAGGAPTAKAGKVFTKWVVQKWDKTEKKFVDTEVERLPGQEFVVNIDDARIQDETTGEDVAEAVSGGHYIYTIQVIAKYEDEEEKIPTHITWYKNDGSGEFYRNDTGIKINEAVSVYGLGEGELPTRTGYTFLGWAKAEEKANAQAAANTSTSETTANFLEYKDGKFYEPGKNTEITKVAADEITPYEALYAIWEREKFYIYHSSTNKIDTVDMPENGKFAMTSKVASEMLYGGYYYYDKDAADKVVIEDGKKKAYTENGCDMTPVAGTTYYLKEVDARYLRPAVYLTWSEIHDGLIRNLYGFVDIDTEDDYTDAGLDIGGEEFHIWGEGKLTNGSIIVTKEGKDNETLTADGLFTIDSAVFGYADLTSKISGGTRLLINGYYKTKDGVKVTGYKTRVIQFDENNPKYNAPVWTGWNNAGNTICGLASVTSTCTPVSRQSTNGRFAVMRSLRIFAPKETVEYTITKVSGSNTDLQTVEEGCRTGEITYAEKKGYYFAGWYMDSAFKKPADFSAVDKDMTVYARYIKASDVTTSLKQKSSKSNTKTFNATVSVKGKNDLKDVTLTVKDDSAYVLGRKSVVKSGSRKNVKYTTQYKGTATVKGLAKTGSFTASLTWTTADGTKVTGPAYKCKYTRGSVKVK